MTPESTLLSRRYADVLRANGCSERTIDNYLYSLKGFCRFLGSLRQASAEDIVAYQQLVAWPVYLEKPDLGRWSCKGA